MAAKPRGRLDACVNSRTGMLRVDEMDTFLTPELLGTLVGGMIGLGGSWVGAWGSRAANRAGVVREAYVDLLSKLDALEANNLGDSYRTDLEAAGVHGDDEDLLRWLDESEQAYRTRYQECLMAINLTLMFDRSRRHRKKVEVMRVWLIAYVTCLLASTADEVARANVAEEQRSAFKKAELALRSSLSGSRHLF